MKSRLTYTILMISSAIMALVLVSCSHHHDDIPTEPTRLYIYVYSPDKPIATRANEGDVTPSDDEKRIHTLQVWVFNNTPYTDDNGVVHPSGELVGYLSPADLDDLNSVGADTYQMLVSDAFAKARPNVDVYVAANVSSANCGDGNNFDVSTTRDELDAALIAHTADADPFGVSRIYSEASVPPVLTPIPLPASGLPMTGKLEAQPIYGQLPVLRIGTEGSISTVKLTRAVSKVRFVFSRQKSRDGDVEEQIEINRVVINGCYYGGLSYITHFPKSEYLFYDGPYSLNAYKTGDTYDEGDLYIVDESLGNVLENDMIAKSNDIYSYVYDPLSQDGQAYEAIIDEGVDDKELTQIGPFYLRETPRQLRGTVRYTLGIGSGATVHDIPFAMAAPLDFTRNHSWIVYVYYHGGARLEVSTVYVKDWAEGGTTNYEPHNW